jgi:hypothetical protein
VGLILFLKIEPYFVSLYMGLQNFKMFRDIPSKDSRDNSESSIHIHENNHGNATVVDPRGSGLERLSLSSHQEQ